ncbi:hypothetical protein AMTRI_Chr13g85610 [Amborella trichopoda]
MLALLFFSFFSFFCSLSLIHNLDTLLLFLPLYPASYSFFSFFLSNLMYSSFNCWQLFNPYLSYFISFICFGSFNFCFLNVFFPIIKFSFLLFYFLSMLDSYIMEIGYSGRNYFIIENKMGSLWMIFSFIIRILDFLIMFCFLYHNIKSTLTSFSLKWVF